MVITSRPVLRRRGAAALAAFATTIALATSALAVPVSPTNPDGSLTDRGGSLVEVGPLAEHGFPAWYRDSNGVRLEACTTLDDPLCSTLPDEVPDPDAPISWPDNFPGEFFYQLAGATLVGPGVDLGIGLDLEGAFANGGAAEGDQMVFGRIRIRDRDIAPGDYRIVHPYGVDEIVVAPGERGINYTQDIGTSPGVFGQALASRVGPFLTWDPVVAPAAPVGYVGDPGVEHEVVGSPYGTNFVSISERSPDGAWVEMARTDLFSIQGRLATNAGVDVQRATYATGADGGGFIDVYASSDAGQAIRVGDAGLGFIETRLEGDRGQYYGRVAVDGTQEPDGRQITVTNASDKPMASKQVRLVDVVTVTSAVYDAGADVLTVRASSSDQDSHPGRLTALGVDLVDGVAHIPVAIPSPTVTVTSDKGGSSTVPILTSGPGMQADRPVAAAFADPIDAAPQQRVTLTGTGSTGTIDSYLWRQVPATVVEDVTVTLPDGTTATQPSTVQVPITDDNRVIVDNASSPVATFNAPADYEGPLSFELVVAGPAGTSEPAVVTVMVTAPDPADPLPAPSADAGDDQVVRRGALVSLDGSRSTLVDTYDWRQVSGPGVTLMGGSTARPTMTLPLMPLPTNTGGANPGYATTATPVVLELSVTGQGGQVDGDEVTVSPAPEVLTIGPAEYRAGREWRVSGTSSQLAGQRIAVVLGDSLEGRVLGFATVDALGAWTFRGAGAVVPSATVTTVSAVSAVGGSITGTTFRRR